ncbi:MAG: S-layer homology domain-containing protein [Candidatus Peregrinibacteria bacterium]
MKKRIEFGLSWGQKAGLMISAFLLVTVALVESSANLKTKAYFKTILTQEDSVQREVNVQNDEGVTGGHEEDLYPASEGSGSGGGQSDRNQNQQQFQQQDTARQLQDAQRSLKERQRNYSDRTRELKQNFRNSKVDTSVVTPLMSAWDEVLKQMEQALNQQDLETYWTLEREDSNDAASAVNDAFQSLYKENEKGNIERTLKDKERSLKDKDRELKNHAREKRDITKLLEIVNQLKTKFEEMKQFVSSSDFDQQEFWDLNRDYDDIDRVFGDESNVLNQQGQSGQIQKVIKEKERGMKDQERTVKEQLRQKRDVSGLQNLIGQMKAKYEEMKQFVSSSDFDPQDFWPLNQEYDDLNREFWDMNNQFQQEQQKGDMTRILSEKSKMIKDLERQCGKQGCGDMSQKVNEIYNQMQQTTQSDDNQAFWDANRELDDTTREFWDQQKEQSETQDIKRWVMDIGRELKDRSKWIQDMLRQAKQNKLDVAPLNKAAEILKQMQAVAEKASQAYQNNDFETARDLLQMDFNDLRQEFDTTMESVKESQQTVSALQEVQMAEKEIGRFEKELQRKKNADPATVETCKGYLGQAKALVQKLKTAVTASDGSSVDDLKMQLEELGGNVEQDCSGIMQMMKGPDYQSVNEVYVQEPNRAMATEVFGKISSDVAAQVVEQIKQNPTLFNTILESVGGQFKDQIAKALEAASFMPKEFQEEMLSRKTALLGQIQEMEALTFKLKELKNELQGVWQQLSSYNFVGDTGTQMEEEISNFITEAQSSGVTKDKIRDFKDMATKKIVEARVEKYKKGVIPFMDADDDQWFSRYAAQAKNYGYVKGTGDSNYTKLDPERATNVAEAVTLFGRVLTEQEKAGIIITGDKLSDIIIQNGRTFNSLPDWAKDGAEELAKAGVDINDLFDGKKAGETVTRAEVAELLQEAFNLPDAENMPNFADTNRVSADEAQAIAAVNEAGIMTGYADGSNRFGADEALNRAALVKVLIKASEQSGSQTESRPEKLMPEETVPVE